MDTSTHSIYEYKDLDISSLSCDELIITIADLQQLYAHTRLHNIRIEIDELISELLDEERWRGL